MKKLLLLFLFLPLLLVSCGGKKSQGIKDDVSLKTMSAKVIEERSIMSATMSVTEENQDYQFLIVEKENQEFNLTIELNNPNDYHIFDFTLECDDQDAQIYLDGTFQLLSGLRSINWNGGTNTRYTIALIISSDSYLNSIRLTSLYYSDRTDNSTKLSANLNGKGVVDIYKVDSMTIGYNNYDNIYIQNMDSHVDVSTIMVNGVPYNNGADIDKDDIYITFTYELSNGVRYNDTKYFIRNSKVVSTNYRTNFDDTIRVQILPFYFNGQESVNVKLYLIDGTLFESQDVSKNSGTNTFMATFDISSTYNKENPIGIKKWYVMVNDKYRSDGSYNG